MKLTGEQSRLFNRLSARIARSGAEAQGDVGGVGGSGQGDRVERVAHETTGGKVGGDPGRVGVAMRDIRKEGRRIGRKSALEAIQHRGTELVGFEGVPGVEDPPGTSTRRASANAAGQSGKNMTPN